MNEIKWTPKAAKQLRKIDRQWQASIRDAVVGLIDMPGCQNVKALTSHMYGYRMRVGQYRVLFDWYGEIRVVEIEEVRQRNERTY